MEARAQARRNLEIDLCRALASELRSSFTISRSLILKSRADFEPARRCCDGPVHQRGMIRTSASSFRSPKKRD